MNQVPGRLPVLALALLILCAASCGLVDILETGADRPWRPPQPVRIEGPGLEQAANLSRISWVAEPEGTGAAAVLLRDRDPLFVGFSGTEEAWLPYHRRDGSPLEVTPDAFGVLLNGERAVIDLSEGSPGWDWLQGAGPQEVEGLRACALEASEGPLRASRWEALQRIRRVNPHAAWLVHGSTT